MSTPVTFSIHTKDAASKARTGTIRTLHGEIKTPAFIPVGTKATVKGMTNDMLESVGAQAVLSNTYHLYLEPGEDRIKKHGGLHGFMHWDKPMFTDSGGFQAFSLGAAFEKGISKLIKGQEQLLIPEVTEGNTRRAENAVAKQATVQEDSVTFYSHLDGSRHVFTPQKSIDIQHALGADIIFAFDECTSPTETAAYQRVAMDRTHRWAQDCLTYHAKSENAAIQGLFAVVQGGREKQLREESAKALAEMKADGRGFDGYGIGGSFDKNDMASAVTWVTDILPEDKPRHLLGIGEPEDVLNAIAQGCDTFDCVAATRIARNGQVYTSTGKINLNNAAYRDDMDPIDPTCDCSTCKNHSRAYIAHLFRADEMLGGMLATVHNLRFIIRLVDGAREAIERGNFDAYRADFLTKYGK
jgi:queuine tRNA-ribosyltransferase